jgi:hypothetical protein
MSIIPRRKQINFSIVPDEQPGEPRTYANFCSISHTPFDFTLTFCEVMPLSERELKEAEQEHVVRAPVRSRVVVPVQFVPNLIAALQEQPPRLLGELLERRLDQGGSDSLVGPWCRSLVLRPCLVLSPQSVLGPRT